MPPYSQTLRQPLKDLRIGLVREHFGAGLDTEVEAAVREAVRVYESLGAKVKQVSLPHSKYAVAIYYVIAPCEASSNLARYDGVHYGYRTDEGADDRRAGGPPRGVGKGRRRRGPGGPRQPAGPHVSPQPGGRVRAPRSSAASCSAPTP